MATINNLEDAAADFLSNATITETTQEGVALASNNGITAFVSNSNDVDLSQPESDNVILNGNANIGVTGNAEANIVAANSGDNTINAGGGDDQVSTGAGNDTISLGDGNDFVTVDGGGIKVIDGGAGNDAFVINPPADANDISATTLTNLNRGDTVTVTVTDANGNGALDIDDVTIATSENGSLTFTLGDGSLFTLDGVGVNSATDGAINYTVMDNGDGTYDVELS